MTFRVAAPAFTLPPVLRSGHIRSSYAACEVAQTFGVPVAHVYVIEFRVTAMLKAEVRRLDHATDPARRNPV